MKITGNLALDTACAMYHSAAQAYEKAPAHEPFNPDCPRVAAYHALVDARDKYLAELNKVVTK